MNLRDLDTLRSEQDAGRWFELMSPVDLTPTGIKLKIAGPDSDVQRRSGVAYRNELAAAHGRQGRVEASRADDIYLRHLANFILDIEAAEDGQAVPFSPDVALRVLRAGAWVRQQVEAFAASRHLYGQGEK